MKGGGVFLTMGIKEGRERVSNVTRIITKLDDDLTVARCSQPMYFGCPRGSRIKWMVSTHYSILYDIIYQPLLTN